MFFLGLAFNNKVNTLTLEVEGIAGFIIRESQNLGGPFFVKVLF